MQTPDISTTAQTITWDDPFRTLIILLFIALLVERGLTAVYATGLWAWIKKPLANIGVGDLKLYVAIIVNVLLAFAINLDAFCLLTGHEPTTIGILITGLFNSGGAKAWADVYSQMQAVRDGKVRSAQAQADLHEAETEKYKNGG